MVLIRLQREALIRYFTANVVGRAPPQGPESGSLRPHLAPGPLLAHFAHFVPWLSGKPFLPFAAVELCRRRPETSSANEALDSIRSGASAEPPSCRWRLTRGRRWVAGECPLKPTREMCDVPRPL